LDSEFNGPNFLAKSNLLIMKLILLKLEYMNCRCYLVST
jgi:hypothetical protein